MDLGLRDKRVLVTGGNSGIGREIVRAFALEGAVVAFTYHAGRAGADALLDELRCNDHDARAFTMDMRDGASMDVTLRAIIHGFGAPDVLVNNAVVWGEQAVLDDLETWQVMLRANLEGYFRCAQAVLPHMRAKGWGRIVSMSSTLVDEGMPGAAAYAAAKSGLKGMTKGIAWDAGREGVLANVILAGMTRTERAEAIIPLAARDQVSKRAPTRRLTLPDEVARVAVFLGPEANGHISGQSIRIAGG